VKGIYKYLAPKKESRVNYQEWEQSVPRSITDDVLWKVQVYRLALFAAEIGWQDVTKLMQDKRTVALADQLYRSLGSISANIAEGYSRSSGKDRARFYEYALGSARESRDWYYKARHVLGETVTNHRLEWLAKIIRLLLKMVPDQRQRVLKEETVIYELPEE
jgi:four helix bundle protein